MWWKVCNISMMHWRNTMISMWNLDWKSITLMLTRWISWCSVRQNCRISSMQRMPGTLIQDSKGPWMHCVVLRVTSLLRTFLVVSDAVLLSAAYSFRSLTYSFLMSLLTTLTLRASTGWSSIYSSMRVQSLPLRTTVTSLMTWASGFLSSIVAKVFLGRATILHGLTRKQSAWNRKRSQLLSVVRPWNVSWNGYVWHQRHVRQRVKHVLTPTNRCSMRSRNNARRSSKYSFLMVHDSVIR